ncbi:E3 ubiquitin-protein ligase RNF144A-like isoform X2 [Protopterus annectens]|uniref:E3 ubiquitin-protein ligase RNF144A-like isoform X2 n=1 Tax=Protopterus annectens TaxID=7888 RepID=UPI001CFB6E63|nr:E3 ubiquitin-protein ligase RNF144A-like isoform X2 [Protopterus annectens]
MPFTGSKKTAKRRHRVKKPQEGSCVDSKQQTRNAEYDPDKCPRCDSLLQKDDKQNLCVECHICSEGRTTPYRFCYACRREWCGPSTARDTCDKENCLFIYTLLSCPIVLDQGSNVYGCPSIRACPKCSALITHSSGCKFIGCQSCSHQFCFICLDSSKQCKARGDLYWSLVCEKEPAGRQTLT